MGFVDSVSVEQGIRKRSANQAEIRDGRSFFVIRQQ